MGKPTLERFSALVGTDVAIGYMRDDSFCSYFGETSPEDILKAIGL